MTAPADFMRVAGTNRAEAVTTWYAKPIRDRKAASHTCAGISYIDRHGTPHTMAWSVLNGEPRRRA